MPDAIGRGGSSKPSDGLKGAFPRYRYHDMVESGYRLITEGLGVGHLRLVIGSSMGGMHAFLWAQKYPELMDGVVPLWSSPFRSAGATGSAGAPPPRRSTTIPNGTPASTKESELLHLDRGGEFIAHRECDAYPGDGPDPGRCRPAI